MYQVIVEFEGDYTQVFNSDYFLSAPFTEYRICPVKIRECILALQKWLDNQLEYDPYNYYFYNMWFFHDLTISFPPAGENFSWEFFENVEPKHGEFKLWRLKEDHYIINVRVIKW